MSGADAQNWTAADFLAPRVTRAGIGAAGSIGGWFCDVLPAPTGQVLVAVDSAVADSDSFRAVLASLEGTGLVPVLVSDFGPELTAEQVDRAAVQVRSDAVVGVVGVGGGSVLDAAKMLALLAVNEGGCADWLGAVDPPSRLPLALVPTTIGTGAEATRIAMVTAGGEKRHVASPKLVPDLAVLDPAFAVSLPPFVKGSTGMDALAHAVESLLSSTSTPLTEAHAYEAIRVITTDLPAAYDGDEAATGRVLYGAYHGGLALNAGAVLGHSLAYAINHERPLPHGTTCAIALPYCVAYNQNLDADRAKRIALALTAGASDRVRDAAERVVALAARVGQPTDLDQAGIPAGREEAMAARTVDLYPRPTNPEPMDRPRVHQLIGAMRGGDLTQAFAVTATSTGAAL